MLDRIEIERSCRALIGAFPYHIDNRHYEEVVGLFTEDGCFERPGILVRGHAELRQMLADRPLKVATCHFCGPTVFTAIADDTVSAVTYFTLYQAEIPASGFPAFDKPAAIAEYHDAFQRTTRGWRIATRKAVVVMVARA